MASVQELLLAAEAKKNPNPLLDLLQSGISGYQTGQGIAKTRANIDETRVDTAIKLIQKQQLQQEIDSQKEMQEQIKQELGLREQETKQSFNEAGTKPKPVMADQKFKTTIEQDEKGRYKRKFETIQAPENKEPETLEQILAQRVKSGEITLEQAFRIKEKPPAPDRSMQREVTKAKVDYAKYKPVVDSAMTEIDRILPLNENSYGGKLGQAAFASASASGIGTESEKFKNTADVLNTMQSQVVKVLKSSFGGQLSDGEREYLNRVYGALPGMSTSERKIAMKNVKKMLSASLEGKKETLSILLEDAGIDPKLLDSRPSDTGDYSGMSDEDLEAEIKALQEEDK